jgi:histone arginine demethylase JMJD6
MLSSRDADALNGIAAAKASLAPNKPPSAWVQDDGTASTTIEHVTGSPNVTINGHSFVDNAQRFPVSDFEQHGDNLPLEPAVITGCCDDWAAFSKPTTSWSVADLAQRLGDFKLSIDGGPSFARESMSLGRVTMSEYESYCHEGAADDTAPLYLFDPDVLKAQFSEGNSVGDEFTIPPCFAHDAMAGLTGSRFRPLPPAWLLVGVDRSGTPIHDHPFFVAWNALLVGCKIWCCFSPDVDESVLLLNDDAAVTEGDTVDDGDGDDEDDEDFEFDMSALQWFGKCCSDGRSLPEGTKIIVQQPGEVAYVPPGWWHVVLNVETSTAICYSLVLRRDIPRLFPPLYESDKDFALSWLDSLSQSPHDVTQALFDLGVVYDDSGAENCDSDGNSRYNPELAATCYARSAGTEHEILKRD